MLILTRRIGEAFFLGNSEVRILTNNRGQIRIGIDAPQEVNIVREELLTVNQKQEKRSHAS
ncbi:MAG: carbon storage regulator [Candidatus Sedimenticola sp. (ex Thyasira tokunagai)]